VKVDLDLIEKQFWPHGPNRNVWMILDGARDRRIYSDLLNSHLIYSCLYSGELPYDLEVAAPFLVQLEYQDKATRGLIQRSWGQSWGIFAGCDATMNRLRRHLRRMLIVQTWRGERLLFRYYDPRVLRVYLPTCTQEELKEVYGPIQRFYTESESADSLSRFEFTRGSKLAHTDLIVNAAPVNTTIL
jgi:Domain of unknown function (DUF4123)